MKSSLVLISFVFFIFGESARASQKLELWPYIEKAALHDEHGRKIEGFSYLAGGAVSLALSFLITQASSPLRDVATYTLIPLGALSLLYGGYVLVTDSSWEKIRKRVTSLGGDSVDSPQWKLRREAHAREALLERASSVRFWRFFWGGLEGGGAIALIAASRDPAAIITASALAGISVYHFLYARTEERIIESLDNLSIGWNSKGPQLLIAFRF